MEMEGKAKGGVGPEVVKDLNHGGMQLNQQRT